MKADGGSTDCSGHTSPKLDVAATLTPRHALAQRDGPGIYGAAGGYADGLSSSPETNTPIHDDDLIFPGGRVLETESSIRSRLGKTGLDVVDKLAATPLKDSRSGAPQTAPKIKTVSDSLTPNGRILKLINPWPSWSTSTTAPVLIWKNCKA